MIEEQEYVKEILTSCPGCNASEIIEVSKEKGIFTCKSCTIFFNNPRPTQEFITKNYSLGGYYKSFHPDKKWDGMWARRCKRVLKRIRGGKLLDVGAGIGTALYMFRKFDFDCVGTEVSAEAIERAKELYDLDLLYGYVENLDLENESFDVITLWHVFEHLPCPGNSLDYLYKKLKKGGYIFLAVPNNSFWRRFYSPRFFLASKTKKLETLIPWIAYDSKFKEIHLIHFNPKSLRQIVEQHGLKVEELTMDNISLNPGMIKDAKYYFRNLLAKHLHIYTHEALFLCAQKI